MAGKAEIAGKVHLLNPPSAPGTLANREGAAGMGVVYPNPDAFFYPPHTIAAVAASLRDAGYAVQALDAVVEELPSDVGQAGVVGVFVSYASLDTDLGFIWNLRTQTQARLIAFGPAMRFVGQEVLARSPVDAVLVGEAEGLFAAAVQHLDRTAASPGGRVLTAGSLKAACCDGDGWVQDLDALPFPAWDLLPYKQYKLLTILGSRGCPDCCAYCPYAAAQGHRFRSRSVESILAELAWLSERFQPARLVFRDPVFARDRGRVAAICEGLLSRGLELHWECESRPEHFDPELLRLMRQAGCTWIKIGLETTDKQLLQDLGRVASADEAAAYLQHTAKVVQTCTQIGLQCRLFVMAGLPGQDLSMAQQTQGFVQRVGPTALSVKAFEAYPGITLPVALESDDSAAQMDVLHRASRQRRLPALVRARRLLRAIWHKVVG
jgi:radical SAM superfamily enzyme YgiQ (UPF0313 family)